PPVPAPEPAPVAPPTAAPAPAPPPAAPAEPEAEGPVREQPTTGSDRPRPARRPAKPKRDRETSSTPTSPSNAAPVPPPGPGNAPAPPESRRGDATAALLSPTSPGVPSYFIDSFRIPPFLLPIYQAAGVQYGIRWEILAAINEIETGYGRNLNVSSAGALGWMQFMPATWRAYGVDANLDGMKDPFNPVDAIFAAARYLRAAGAHEDLERAIFAYNHADWYVRDVLRRAKLVAALPTDLVSSLTGLTQGIFPVADAGTDAHGSVPRVRPDDGERRIRISARSGSAVTAVTDGTIVKTGRTEELGRYVKLRDSYGNTYTYANLQSFATEVPVPKPQATSREEIVAELDLPTRDEQPDLAASTTGTPADPRPLEPVVAEDDRPAARPASGAGAYTVVAKAPPASVRAPLSPAPTEAELGVPGAAPPAVFVESGASPVASAPPAATTPATPPVGQVPPAIAEEDAPAVGPATTPAPATPTAPEPSVAPEAPTAETGPVPPSEPAVTAPAEPATTVPEPAATTTTPAPAPAPKPTPEEQADPAIDPLLPQREPAIPPAEEPEPAAPEADVPSEPEAPGTPEDDTPPEAEPTPAPDEKQAEAQAARSISDYFTIDYGLERDDVELKPLREGGRVIAGTVLGRTGGDEGAADSDLGFEIRPAGQGSPRVDPRPIVKGWQLLESTALYRARAADVKAGTAVSIGQIMLMDKQTLQRRVLDNPRIDIYSCGRRDISAGIVDRRVLATLEYLAAVDLKPTVTSLRCGHGVYTASGNVSHHTTGTAVDIAAINGTPILGNQGKGSITDQAVRRLLSLQGTMRPSQIITLMRYEGADNTVAMADHHDHIHIGWRPTLEERSDTGQTLESLLKPQQWNRLIDRLNEIDNPEIPTKPSRYAERAKRGADRLRREGAGGKD
ncbi:MAG: lytic murein transglycosylase, partial [Solirubrobacteraceae bacterium]|nr:lytic murein transglycosylase [Solirubrobacteraceae bacterium]